MRRSAIVGIAHTVGNTLMTDHFGNEGLVGETDVAREPTHPFL